MSAVRSLAIGACLVAVSLSPARAAGPLDLRTGLWEITSAGRPGMQALPLPPDMLTRLSPAQRARIELGIMAAGLPQTVKLCLTSTGIAKALQLAESNNQPSCARTVVTNTAKTLEVRGQCAGARLSRGDVRLDALDRQTVKGTVEVTLSTGGQDTTIRRTLDAKWLDDDCGDVKPPA